MTLEDLVKNFVEQSVTDGNDPVNVVASLLRRQIITNVTTEWEHNCCHFEFDLNPSLPLAQVPDNVTALFLTHADGRPCAIDRAPDNYAMVDWIIDGWVWRFSIDETEKPDTALLVTAELLVALPGTLRTSMQLHRGNEFLFFDIKTEHTKLHITGSLNGVPFDARCDRAIDVLLNTFCRIYGAANPQEAFEPKDKTLLN